MDTTCTLCVCRYTYERVLQAKNSASGGTTCLRAAEPVLALRQSADQTPSSSEQSVSQEQSCYCCCQATSYWSTSAATSCLISSSKVSRHKHLSMTNRTYMYLYMYILVKTTMKLHCWYCTNTRQERTQTVDTYLAVERVECLPEILHVFVRFTSVIAQEVEQFLQ